MIIEGGTTISLTLLISFITVVITIFNLTRTIRKDDKEAEKHKEKEIEEKIKMNVKLDSLCNTTNQILIDNKTVINKIEQLETRLVKVEQSTKSAHRRLDSLDNKKEETNNEQ
ncbi:MAG: hypothetical protein ACLSWA_14040 [Thomasclavelia spiroformis]|jgi:hypothetical protein